MICFSKCEFTVGTAKTADDGPQARAPPRRAGYAQSAMLSTTEEKTNFVAPTSTAMSSSTVTTTTMATATATTTTTTATNTNSTAATTHQEQHDEEAGLAGNSLLFGKNKLLVNLYYFQTKMKTRMLRLQLQRLLLRL